MNRQDRIIHGFCTGIAIVAALGLAGCGVSGTLLKKWSSGEIGCRPAEIALTDADATRMCPGTSTWEAHCRGRMFRCTSTCQGDGRETSCTEMLAEPAADLKSADDLR